MIHACQVSQVQMLHLKPSKGLFCSRFVLVNGQIGAAALHREAVAVVFGVASCLIETVKRLCNANID